MDSGHKTSVIAYRAGKKLEFGFVFQTQGGWWLSVATAGHGVVYDDLREAMQRWERWYWRSLIIGAEKALEQMNP